MTTIDTNVLVRILNDDGSPQANAAGQLFRSEEGIVVPLIVFCESAWVLRSSYGRTRTGIAASFQTVVSAPHVTCDPAAVRFGMDALARGIDFADAIVALEGQRLGGSTFASFDRKAVRHLASAGLDTRLLG